MYHDVILLCPMATKLVMVLVDVISCDDLEGHWILNSFELVLNSNRMAKKGVVGVLPFACVLP